MNKDRAHAIGWAAVIIGALTILRIAKGAGGPPYGIDASYYFQIARHIANGEGFVTTVSLYHEGWIVPAKTPIYPLWPLVLGYAGRAIGLVRAADLLPRIFYIVDLVLLYLVARAAAQRIGAVRFGTQWWIPDGAHWIVAIFGLTPRFFGATTHPYTEGLGFAMSLAAFLALERFDRTRASWAAALSGLFAALAFLTRTQMAAVAIGCFLAMAWFALRDRSARTGVIVWSLVAIAAIVPWFLFLGYVPYFGWAQGNANIPPLEAWTKQSTTAEWLAMRVKSLGIMFDPSNSYSYVQSMGIAAFLVPLAAIGVILELVRRKKIAAPQNMFRMAILIAGLFFFLNLSLYQSAVWMPWLFGWRHGLPFIFLIVLAVPWLIARAQRAAPAIAIVLLISVVTNATAVLAFVRTPDVALTRGEAELVGWLDAHPRRVAVMTTNAQILGSMTDTRFYWTDCNSPADTTRAMLREMPIDYVVLYEHELKCPFAMIGPMRIARVFGTPGRRVFVLKRMS